MTITLTRNHRVALLVLVAVLLLWSSMQSTEWVDTRLSSLVVSIATPALPSPSTSPLPSFDFVEVYKYHEKDNNGEPVNMFYGLRDVHMTHHYCVGIRRYNHTCMFKNLVLNGERNQEGTMVDHAVWEYYTYVSADSSAAQVSARRDAVLQEVGVIYQHSCSSLSDLFQGTWEVSVRIFFEVPTGIRLYLKDNELDGTKPAWNGRGFDRRVIEQYMLDPQGNRQQYDEYQMGHYYGACNFTASLPVPIDCLPPSVSSVFGVPAGYLLRAVHWNLGHTMFDDLLPLFTAAHDLGVYPHFRQFVPLFSSVPNEMGMLWGDNRLTKQLYPAISPYHHPILYYELARATLGQRVVFRTLITGLSGRSPHGITPEYSVPGLSYRSMWLFRNYYIENLGLSSLDKNWHRNSTDRVNVVLLQKGDKRRVTTMPQIADKIKSKYPNANVEILDWASLGGFVNEVKKMLNTHIMAGVDGTGMMGAFLLPPGSVYISIPSAGKFGFPEHLGDFMINGVDYFRILYYDGLAPGEYGAGIQSDIQIPPDKFDTTFTKAMTLVTSGYDIPVPFYENHSPAAQMFVRFATTFPQYHSKLSQAWMEYGPVADRLQQYPERFWAESIGGEVSPLLQDVVDGRLGAPHMAATNAPLR